MNPYIQRNILPEDAVLSDAIRVMNQGVYNVALFVDAEKKLVGLLTDGDFRRAFLDGATLHTPVSDLMNRNYLSARAGQPIESYQLLLTPKIRYLPILNSHGELVDLIARKELNRVPIMEPYLGGNELKYVTDCITSGWISSQGSYVKLFEQQFASFLDLPHALTTSNGTTALHLALTALGVGPGDEVIVPDLTFAASINAVLYTGATPVLVDVHPDTWTLDPTALQAAITEKSRAVMPVHLYGHPCDMGPIMEIARKHKMFVVEDCAESLGAKYQGAHTGTFGDIGCFSFFSNKVITTGEGGMVVTSSAELREKMAVLRDHGMSKDRRYYHDIVGFNYRMTNLQAAIGVAQLEQVEGILVHRRRIAKAYGKALRGIKGIKLPVQESWANNINWLYSLLVDSAISGISTEQVALGLTREGFETRPFFYPLHLQPPYKAYGNGEYPVTESVTSQGISLPSSSTIPDSDIQRVCECLRGIVEHDTATTIVTLEETGETTSTSPPHIEIEGDVL